MLESAHLNTEIYFPSASEPTLPASSFDAYGNIPWLVPKEKSPEAETSGRDQESRIKLSPWCASIWKRAFDLVCVAPALILISPIFGIIAIAVRLTSPGPMIFRQQRAGQHRKLFTIYKFRTMVENSETIGPGHTAKGDPRITPLGHFLRRFKLDELPQLYNVLRGEMSLVGPRPKLPNHELTPMICRPGVTGAATLAFRNEQHLLCRVPARHLETYYREHIIPLKMNLDTDYMQVATLVSDIHVLLTTVSGGGRSLTYEDLSQSKS
jgi:lipopolysaccharide/colanic/teichoic acid biosynthesis glycosyltransferase